MWIVGRIMLVILMVIGALSFAGGIACIVGANDFADTLGDYIDGNVSPGIFTGAGAGALALGMIILVISAIFLYRRHREKVLIDLTPLE